MNTNAPIIFVPGWGATARIWEGVRAELPDRATHMLDWAALLQDFSPVNTLLAGLSVTPLLVGWSLGALMALNMALEFPGRFKGVILVSGTAHMCGDGDYPGANPRALKAMQLRLLKNRESVLADFAALCAAPDGTDAMQKSWLEQAASFSTETLAQGLHALATMDLRTRAPELTTPARLIHGGNDGVIPSASAQALAARLPQARLEIIGGRGHALPLTIPAELARHIRSFEP